MIQERRALDELGLSPRVRGNLHPSPSSLIFDRSIPACAGEPAVCRGRRAGGAVYPRVCGGTLATSRAFALSVGLSPRVRGNLTCHSLDRPRLRSIPACAGEPSPCVVHRSIARVYPRVCGGTASMMRRSRATGGLSPRVRGNPMDAVIARARNGSIPACAGEPATAPGPAGLPRVYPRVCGGTDSGEYKVVYGRGLSPRVRGNPRRAGLRPHRVRSIPACAGEPAPLAEPTRDGQVYPRVCGGTTTCNLL